MTHPSNLEKNAPTDLITRLWKHIWNDDGHGNGWFPDERCQTCGDLYNEMKAIVEPDPSAVCAPSEENKAND